MILSDRTIIDFIDSGKIVIDPYDERNVQSASIDLRLGEGFLVPDYYPTEPVSLGEKLEYRNLECSSIVIPPRHFILGTTLEYLTSYMG